MEIPLELLAFIAIVLGVIGRTLLPYIKKKMQEDGDIEFDYNFITTAVFSGIMSAIFVFPLFVFPEGANASVVFVTAFIFAWTANDGINRVVK